MTPKIRSRKPTGVAPWPFLLLAGDEKSGKTLVAARLSRSDKIGPFYWIDLGEGSADEYGAIKGASYEVIEHDGTYHDILEQVTAVHAAALEAAEKGEPPVCLSLDTGTALWRMLVNWTNERARRSRNGKRKLEADPDAEVDITMNLWNDCNDRWQRVMDLLLTFPGIVVVTARGKEVSAIDEDGRPIEGTKEWKVEGQKNLGFDATATIRMYREGYRAELVSVRSLNVQLPGGKPLELPKDEDGFLSLEHVVFGMLGCVVGASKARDFHALSGDAAQRFVTLVGQAIDEDALKQVWEQSKAERNLTPQHRETIREAVTTRLGKLRTPDELAEGDAQAEALRQAAGQEPPTDKTGPAAQPEPDAPTGPTRDAIIEKANAKGYTVTDVIQEAEEQFGVSDLELLEVAHRAALLREFTARRKRPQRESKGEAA